MACWKTFLRTAISFLQRKQLEPDGALIFQYAVYLDQNRRLMEAVTVIQITVLIAVSFIVLSAVSSTTAN
jgi:hypothetical protein